MSSLGFFFIPWFLSLWRKKEQNVLLPDLHSPEWKKINPHPFFAGCLFSLHRRISCVPPAVTSWCRLPFRIQYPGFKGVHSTPSTSHSPSDFTPHLILLNNSSAPLCSLLIFFLFFFSWQISLLREESDPKYFSPLCFNDHREPLDGLGVLDVIKARLIRLVCD